MPASAAVGADTFRSPAAGALRTVVANHVVQGRVIFPGTAYLEMARAAAGTSAALRDVFFLQPLAIEAVSLLVECTVADGRFEVRSLEADEAMSGVVVHCSGAIVAIDGWQHVDHASVRGGSCAFASDCGALYDEFDAVGLQYGPGYRTLLQGWGGMTEAISRLRVRSTHEGTHVHPADLDDVLCTSAVVVSLGGDGGGTGARLPFAVDDALLRAAPGHLWAVRCTLTVTPLRPAL